MGREHYKLVMLADIPHPAVYGSLLGALIWALAGDGRIRILALLALFTALFDWAENLFIWRMFSAPLPVDESIAGMSNGLSFLKHGVLTATMLVLVLLFVRALYRALTR